MGKDAENRVTPANSNNQGLLSSWKEIAGYLECDERTCRRWELNFGLPIHRMEGTPKSRVYAYGEERDAWRKERLNSVLHKNGEGLAARRPTRVKIFKILPWLLPLLAVISAAAVFLLRSSPGQPDLKSEKAYRERFQVIMNSPSNGRPLFPCLTMRDIDADDKIEVLFSAMTRNDSGSSEISCFNSSGEKIWHHKAGREVDFGGRIYSNDFRIGGFMPFDIDDDGHLEILVLAFHNPHSPSQLLILDTDGQVMGDFFNFGQMHDFLCCDLDGEQWTSTPTMNRKR